MELEWDEEDTEDVLDELIEQVTEAEDEGTGPQVDTGYEEIAPSASNEVAGVAPEETITAHKESAMKRKVLSLMGMVFAVLTVVSIIGLVVVLNYDTWIAGESESNIGDTQMMYVYLAVAAVVVCIVLVAWDWMRTRRAATA